jgi:hypothetical protein
MKVRSVVANQALKDSLNKRIFVEERDEDSLSDAMKRDQRSLERINAWTKHISSDPKPK